MNITKAEFICSNTNVALCPKEQIPEYAFTGRSNVGKSSLINMLVERKKLAKTSSTPGKRAPKPTALSSMKQRSVQLIDKLCHTTLSSRAMLKSPYKI